MCIYNIQNIDNIIDNIDEYLEAFISLYDNIENLPTRNI